jgi:histone H3/H4
LSPSGETTFLLKPDFRKTTKSSPLKKGHPSYKVTFSFARAALNKMIKELIPNIRVANDARELILNCCTEFIHLVSSEANEICNKQQKKTISPEHVLQGIFDIH